ncbi:50S ribosome-binding GTPase [Myxococcota bacterium]|nr:50S ribosome-binding GTPase [Myxococcota bacterium]MBU1381324.1 50S ribosome-binding GTPase [Myxococcota bacterium]MBU1495701.1 50S ribosome-binding GTPase [Myxococcota bacterium]
MSPSDISIFLETPVFATATPPGVSALAIVRLTGWNLKPLLEPHIPGISKLSHSRARLIEIPGIDRAVVTWFEAPASYTGQDVLELSVHGNPVIVQKLSEFLEKNGATAAQAGEFSYRAVLNGKMSVEEAEKINAVIMASSEAEINLIRSSSGINLLLEDILGKARELLAIMETAIEFDEEITFPDLETLRNQIDFIRTQGKITRNKHKLPKVLLYGPPNCGKSTLFNAIIGFERAIVSDVPGTTRDYLEVEVTVKGHRFVLIDSAGVREITEEIENAGVNMTLSLFESCDIILNCGPSLDDPRCTNLKTKSDIERSTDPGIINVSAVKREGLGELMNKIADQITNLSSDNWQLWVSERITDDLENMYVIVSDAISSPLMEIKAEFLGKLIVFLEGLLGYEDFDLYGMIFSRFCIGK